MDLMPDNTMPDVELQAAAGPPVAGDFLLDELPPNTSPKRHLYQAAADKQQVRVCNKGTPTKSPTPSYVKRSLSTNFGTQGINLQATNVVPPDPTLAVGPVHALHVVNSLVKIIPLTPSGNIDLSPRPGQQRTIPLPDFFALVASPCDGGYIYPWAAYDKEIGRFLLTCVCGGDSNMVRGAKWIREGRQRGRKRVWSVVVTACSSLLSSVLCSSPCCSFC